MFKHNVEVSVPFETTEFAKVAYEAIRVEAEVKPKLISTKFDLNENNLIITFSSNSLKMIRLSVNNRLEMLALISKTIHHFNPSKLDI
ncbi:transcription factor Pcc1 [Conidiobolus coronatus NRRL 28638]|uniref:Transcription factor Pcc1 n=1 Tax=Conidiobolus coronatus (strain ATCC 28846 / CBS 209.66 / NRRL 28638) TaxID=796925 RepID=A0A137PDD4_CONC2|nr:transcription factor Pcc1 [Conidiobolus coronatus NRRL 28638]|eukprot:KXN72985.1 transcription factor Pcc1 [Conidiobolus coronatus NRRL 28638]